MRFENETLTYECFCEHICRDSDTLSQSKKGLLCGSESINSSIFANLSDFQEKIFLSECMLSITSNGTDVLGMLKFLIWLIDYIKV